MEAAVPAISFSSRNTVVVFISREISAEIDRQRMRWLHSVQSALSWQRLRGVYICAMQQKGRRLDQFTHCSHCAWSLDCFLSQTVMFNQNIVSKWYHRTTTSFITTKVQSHTRSRQVASALHLQLSIPWTSLPGHVHRIVTITPLSWCRTSALLTYRPRHIHDW